MARQLIDIGAEGNDGTGDSIREAFRKVNGNFNELYAVFGQGDQLSFLDLGDTPDTYFNNQGKVPVVSVDAVNGDNILAFKSISGGLGVTVNVSDESIVISSTSSGLMSDESPQFAYHVNSRDWTIGNLGELTIDAVREFNIKYYPGGINGFDPNNPNTWVAGIDSFAITKGFADSNYVNISGDAMSGSLILSGDPVTALEAATKQYVDNNIASTLNLVGSSALSITGDVGATSINLSDDMLAISGTANEVDTQIVGDSVVIGLPNSVTINQLLINTSLNLNNNTINNVKNPIAAQDAATKSYVDTVAQGLVVKPAAKAATTGNLTATYNNGASGVGATLTINPTATLTIDGISSWSLNDGILVKNQTNALQNGRYYISQLGNASTSWILTRCGYCDQPSEIFSMYVFVADGTLNQGTGWVATVNDTLTFAVGVDAINFIQFSGGGTVTVGSGLALNGTQISHSDTSSVANVSSDNSNNTFIQDIDFQFDTFGHVTAATVSTGTVVIGDATLTISAGSGLSGSGTFTANQNTNATISLAHANTSNAANLVAGTRTYVTGLTFDTYGHVTAYTTGTETVVDTDTITRLRGTASGTYTSGDLTLLSGGATTVSQSGSNFTISSTDTITRLRGTTSGTYTEGDITIAGSGATTVSQSGSTITISSTDNNTITRLRGTATGTYTSGDLTITGGGSTSVSQSGSTITISSSGTTYTGGTGVTVSGSTISIGQDVATTANVQFRSIGINTAPSATAGEIRATGEITAFYSDDRLKTKLGMIENPLEKISQLSGFYYQANEVAQKLGYDVKREVGVSAQELQRILPEVVHPAPIDSQYLTVNYGKIVPLLIEAIKELKLKVEELESKLNS